MSEYGEGDTFLGGVYLAELKRVVSDHKIGAALLARDWSEKELTHASRGHLLYHRRDDVQRFLRRSTESIINIGIKYRQAIGPYAHSQHLDSPLNRALGAVAKSNIRFSNEMLYPELGLNFIVFTDELMYRTRYGAVGSNPSKEIPKLEKTTHNPELVPVLRTAADSQIFKGALNGKKGFDEAMSRTECASAPVVRRAMRAGLDHKVFIAARSIQEGETISGISEELGDTLTAEAFVDYYASTSTSAQMIHDHFAKRNIVPDNEIQCCEDFTYDILPLQLEAARTFAVQEALRQELSHVKKAGNKLAEKPIKRLIELNNEKLARIAPVRYDDSTEALKTDTL